MSSRKTGTLGTQRGASVRSRMLAGIISMVIVTMAASSVLLYYLLHRDMTSRVDDSLERSVREYAQRVKSPNSPLSGLPYEDAEAFLYEAMQATLPSEHEGMVATIDRTVRWKAAQNVLPRLEDDKEFMAWAVAADISGTPVLRSVTTKTTTYRAVILPAKIPDDSGDARFILAFDMGKQAGQLKATFVPYIWAAAGSLVVAAVISWFLTGRLLRPLRALRNTAQMITDEDLSQRIEVKAKGELAELTYTFNAMLDRVEDAVDSQKQLLDDVGHELRTPITIVRGHLEVLDPSDPHDVEATRTLAIDELDRMSVLVSDLLLLAKKDRADFVSLEPTSLDELAESILAKASQLGARDWQVEANSKATVLADPARLTQAVLQLCENAVKYSPHTAEIVIRTGRTGERAFIEVSDTGFGMTQTDLDVVFNRFERGSHGHQADGSGLGLSIVQAIVGAHHGELDVNSQFTIGSTFRIMLDIHAISQGTDTDVSEHHPG